MAADPVITLQDRVEDLIGAVSDTDALGIWLTVGARVVIDMLSEDAFEEVATEKTVTSDGLALGDYRIYAAHKSGYGARKLPSQYRTQVQDFGSIHYALEEDPVMIIYGGKVYIYPDGGTLLALDYPSVSATADQVTGLMRKHDQIVVFYAAVQTLLSEIGSGITSIPLLEAGLPEGFLKPTFEGDFSTITAPLDTKEDVELANGHIGRIRTYLEKYASELQSLGGEINIYTTRLKSKLEEMSAKTALLGQLLEQYKVLIQVHLGA